MKAHRLVVTFAAVASVATLIGAGAAATNGSPDWRDALDARSAALNERYGLGADAGRRTLGVPGQQCHAHGGGCGVSIELGRFRQAAGKYSREDFTGPQLSIGFK
jgi:hypothetical protein